MVGNLKEQLKSGKPVIGTFTNVSDPAVIELLGYVGFDFVIVDMEHGPATTRELESLVRAADLAKLPVVVRVPGAQRVPILKALDCGGSGVLVPMVDDSKTAADAAFHAHYPPFGGRGLATYQRSIRYGQTEPQQYLEDVEKRVLTVVQIETRQAVEQSEEISHVEGVDVLFIGPSDLSMSLGVFGQPEHETLQTAIDQVVQAGLQAGKAVGTLVGTTEQARQAIDRGMRFIAWGTTLGMLSAGAKNTLDAWKSLTSSRSL
ncbi:hypothetical protein LLE49_14260 [Alicyclobacillus tolerans]|uniref:HpcH/HpaI aldolase family protein n=1 Tax=Alicyclobacillus tolerans TaxID=90970 RepID=UPI001F00D6A8|nr:aldolase/citrate lyase family protein [Alicyclobacillus tolerans]MCF8565885.1 hypothetical protein [Alicyclobacillus tolerans]